VFETDLERGSRQRHDYTKAGAADGGPRKQCDYCGRYGHTEKQCFKKRRESRKP
jgi:hypothetical protein